MFCFIINNASTFFFTTKIDKIHLFRKHKNICSVVGFAHLKNLKLMLEMDFKKLIL